MPIYQVYRDELYHHGILGMKWGVRRYQRKDGSLTPRGEKHLKELEEEYNRLKGGSQAKPAAPKKKSISEMSDDELRARANRLRLEKEVKDLDRQLNPYVPSKKEKALDFLSGLMKNAVIPAVQTAGKKWLEQQIDRTILEQDPVKNATDKLKKAYDNQIAARDLKMIKNMSDEEYRSYRTKDSGGKKKDKDDYDTYTRERNLKTLKNMTDEEYKEWFLKKKKSNNNSSKNDKDDKDDD